MTVLSDLSQVSYAGDNVSTSFATSPMVFFVSADLFVTKVTNATGVSVTLVEGTGYSVTGGNGAVGTVNLAGGSIPHGPLLVGTTLIITRLVALTQGTDFVNGDQSDAEVVEKSIDRLTMIAQQFDPAIRNALKAPITELTDQRFSSSDWVARAGKVVAFDSGGVLKILAGFALGVIAVTNYILTLFTAPDAPAARLVLKVIDSPNYSYNSDFEQWDAGTAVAPTGWTLTGGAATVAKNTTAGQFKYGTASAALTRSGNDAALSQDVSLLPGFAPIAVWRGKTVTLGCWIRATVASRARISVSDGVVISNSAYHSGGGTFEFLTVTQTIDAAATICRFDLQLNAGDTTAQYDGAVLVQGGYVADYFPPTVVAPSFHQINRLRTTVASATTPDIWTGTSFVIDYTGTTTSTGLTTAPAAGAQRLLICAGASLFTHGANYILPGSANHTSVAGDKILVDAITTSQFRLTVFKADGTAVVGGSFATGTRLLFQQTSAPTGWTKEASATYNDAALRFTTGTVGTGGADAFNTLFGTSKSTAGFTLTTADIASHSHVEQLFSAGGSTITPAATVADATPLAFNISTQATGGGGSHSHTLSNFNLKWADCIIASKD